MRRPVMFLLAGLLAAGCAGGKQTLVVAAGTTVYDSGILSRIIELYTQEHPGLELSLISAPARLVFELGAERSADLLITNAPGQEAGFIESGAATPASAPVFNSRFIVVGPETWLQRARGLEAPEVFRMVAEEDQLFVSRGDGSGTHDNELSNWLESGIDPSSERWYLETGEGMGETLLIADQRAAVTLTERGVYLAAGNLALVDMELDPGGLESPYTAIVVAGAAGEDPAVEFLEWLRSEEGVAAIVQANLELFGELVYEPEGESG